MYVCKMVSHGVPSTSSSAIDGRMATDECRFLDSSPLLLSLAWSMTTEYDWASSLPTSSSCEGRLSWWSLFDILLAASFAAVAGAIMTIYCCAKRSWAAAVRYMKLAR